MWIPRANKLKQKVEKDEREEVVEQEGVKWKKDAWCGKRRMRRTERVQDVEGEWEEMVNGESVPQSFTLFSANIAWRFWNIQRHVSDTMLFLFWSISWRVGQCVKVLFVLLRDEAPFSQYQDLPFEWLIFMLLCLKVQQFIIWDQKR